MFDDGLQKLAGLYYFQSMLLKVSVSESELITSMPDVPAGYEMRSERIGDNQYRLVGGPADGAVASFALDDTGAATAMQVGPLVFPRVDSAENLPIMRRFAAPDWQLSAEQQAAFDALLATVDQHTGEWLDYSLPYPKYQFLQYATRQNRYMFHGSNNQTIDELVPIRKSVELNDESGRGNVQGVYGTHEALWAMFFSVVDRDRLRGTIRNGVVYFHNTQGDTLPLFSFSINQEQLAERPYCDGALYILPRASFRRLPMWGDVMSNEWASEVAVKPLAKLRIAPDDFPFLGQMQGHDDGELIRLEELAKQIQTAATAATLEGDQFTVWVENSAEVDAYIELQAKFMPTVSYTVEQIASGVKLTASNVPPAFQQVLRDRYQDLL